MYVRPKISARRGRALKTLETFDETCNLLRSSFKGDHWGFSSPFVLFALQSCDQLSMHKLGMSEFLRVKNTLLLGLDHPLVGVTD